MWILYAILSAAFAAVNALLSKQTADRTTPVTANAARTGAVLLFAVVAMLLTHGANVLANLNLSDYCILLGAGAATTGAWIFYFRALSHGTAESVSAIDKFSVVLTSVGGAILGNEPFRFTTLLAIGLLSFGILQIIKCSSTSLDSRRSDNRIWWIAGLTSAVLMAISVLLSRITTQKIPPEAALAVRTGFVFVLSHLILCFKCEGGNLKQMDRKTALILLLSGLLTGAGWLCSFRALAQGNAAPVHAIERLSLPFTVLLSYLINRRTCSFAYWKGLFLMVIGMIGLAFDIR